MADATWLAQLGAHGLVAGSFVPPALIRALRDLTRTRTAVTRERGRARGSWPAAAAGPGPPARPGHATAALVWSSDLPRPLQQMLFDTADSLTGPPHPQPADLVSLTTARATRQSAQTS